VLMVVREWLLLCGGGGTTAAAMEMRTAACSRENGRHHWCRLDVLVAAVTESAALLQAR